MVSIASARRRQSALISVSLSRFALYSTIRCGMASRFPCSLDLSCNVHRGDGAADGKDRNRRIVLQVPAAARRGCDADEGANLEAALTGVAIGVGIRIRQKRPLVIAHPAIEQLPIPGFVRSEEHTSELQSLRHLVCRLLLEK